MIEIDYYYFPLSPYCYLAGDGLEKLATRHNTKINYKPFELLRVFSETGTLPPKDRHESRKQYRLKDLARTARANGLPINLQPAHWPTNPVPACAAVIAAQQEGNGDTGALCQGLLRAVWAEDRDIAEDAVVRDCLTSAGFDADLADKGMLSAVEILQRNTDEALSRLVFGAPTYAVGEEVFWGQDRLGYLDTLLTELS